MGAGEAMAVIVPLVLKYGPSAIDAVEILVGHLKAGGELSQAEEERVLKAISDRSKRIQES